MLSLGDQLGRAGTGKSTPAENMSLTSDVRRWRLNTDCVRQDTRKPMKWLNVINGQISEVLATHRCEPGQDLAQMLKRYVLLYNPHLPQQRLQH